MRREHMPFQYMRQFKAFAADFEYYLSLSDKPVSVCLTERQMYILSVWNSYTPWITRWYNTDDASIAGLKAIAAEIEDLLMCGCGVPEPSFTDRLNSQVYITNTATTYETTYNTWNDAGQTVVSIAPDLDYSSGVPGDIDKLLCLALEMLLVAIVEAAKANKSGTEQDNRDMVKNLGNVFGALATAGGVATAAGGAAAAFVGFLGGPYLILGLALSAVGLAVANLIWTTDLSVFNDQTAIDDVKCTLVNNIIGNTPSRPVFQAGLSPNDFASGSNAEKLAAIVQPYLDDLDTYLQWLATAQGLYEVANFGLLPDCGCIPPIEGLWAIFPGYAGLTEAQSGMITAQTETSVSFSTDEARDGEYRIVAQYNSFGLPVTIVTSTNPGAILAKYHGVGSSMFGGTFTNSQLVASDTLNYLYFTNTAPFTLAITFTT